MWSNYFSLRSESILRIPHLMRLICHMRCVCGKCDVCRKRGHFTLKITSHSSGAVKRTLDLSTARISDVHCGAGYSCMCQRECLLSFNHHTACNHFYGICAHPFLMHAYIRWKLQNAQRKWCAPRSPSLLFRSSSFPLVSHRKFTFTWLGGTSWLCVSWYATNEVIFRMRDFEYCLYWVNKFINLQSI